MLIAFINRADVVIYEKLSYTTLCAPSKTPFVLYGTMVSLGSHRDPLRPKQVSCKISNRRHY